MTTEETKELLISLLTLAEDQQKAVTAALEGLASEREALGKEREGLRAALLSELAEKTTEALKSATVEAAASLAEEQTKLAEQVQQATYSARTLTRELNDIVRSFSWRYVALWGAVVVGHLLMVFGLVAWKQAEVDELRAKRDALVAELPSLEATAAQWEQKAGRATLTVCGPKKRPCARVKPEAGVFGDQSEVYYILHGY